MVDAGMLEQVLNHLHNWFAHGSIDASDCEIAGGALPASIESSMPDGVWYRIQGSLMNDGLHRNPAEDLMDETFSGTITICAVPNALLDVVEEIGEYVSDMRESDREARRGKYKSESFGGYTYQLRDDSRASGSNGGLTGWQAAFATDLNPWRKIA